MVTTRRQKRKRKRNKIKRVADLVFNTITTRFWDSIRWAKEKDRLLQTKLSNLEVRFVNLCSELRKIKLSTAGVAIVSWTSRLDTALDSCSRRLAKSVTGQILRETCGICFDSVVLNRMFSIDGCSHRYCFSCLKQYAMVKVFDDGVLSPRCPYEDCKSVLTIENCRALLEPKLIDLMTEKMKEALIPIEEKVYCPHPRCSALMSRREASDYTDTHLLPDEGDRRKSPEMRKCSKCLKLFCINCLVPWHQGMNCEYFRQRNPPDHAKVKRLASKKKWRQCVKCYNLIQLAEGCFHIYCRCGHEFCYTCGVEWIEKRPTCQCPIWDENFIVRQ